LVTAYMPFMIFPIWLSLSGIDERLLEASWVLGAPALATFWRVTLPLSLPGVFAAAIFGFVGSFGEVAVSLILGGTGYQLLGNAIASALDAELSARGRDLLDRDQFDAGAAVLWYRLFDVRLLPGKIMGRA
jgi:ABC-type spermidine/putrescine transport system permease subunit I